MLSKGEGEESLSSTSFQVKNEKSDTVHKNLYIAQLTSRIFSRTMFLIMLLPKYLSSYFTFSTKHSLSQNW